MSIFDPYSPFLRFWRRNVNALEMERKMQPRRRRRRKMKYKTHLEHREKGLVLFHKNILENTLLFKSLETARFCFMFLSLTLTKAPFI